MELFYKILSEICNCEIHGENELLTLMEDFLKQSVNMIKLQMH